MKIKTKTSKTVQSFIKMDLSSRFLIKKEIYTHLYFLKLVYKPYKYILKNFFSLIIYFITKIFINESFSLIPSLSK